MKQCPVCGESIQKDAIKCRFCGEEISKKSNFKWLSMKGFLLILLFWPFLSLWWVWAKSGWSGKKKIYGTTALLVVFFVFILTNNLVNRPMTDEEWIRMEEARNRGNSEASPTQTPTPVPIPTIQPERVSSLQKIYNIANNDDAEVTVWSGDDFATEENAPYEVIINFPINNNFSCDNAQKQSYYLIEELYMNEDTRNDLSRVLVTIPNALRVSLGATDGVPMAEGNIFSGPTNFWTVMQDFLTEDETGNLEDRTWANLLLRCE